MYFRKFLGELRRRLALVIALMILCSLGLAIEKYFTSQGGMHMSGDAYVQQMVRLVRADEDVVIDPPSNKSFFTTSPLGYYKFLESADFDFDRLNGNWSGMSLVNRIIWLTKHLEVTAYDPNVYVFSLMLESSTPHDYDYVKANAPRLLDAYVEFARRECAKAELGDLVLIERAELIPDGVHISRKRIVLKYATVGAALGLIAGLIVVFGLSVRKSDG